MPVASHQAVARKAGTSTAFLNEPCTAVVAGLTYRINTDAKRLLNPQVPVVVEVDDGGGFDPATGYTINYLFGLITFAVSQGANAVRVSGEYIPVATYAEVTEYSFTASRSNIETTPLNTPDKTRILGNRDFSGSLTLNAIDDAADTAHDDGSPWLFEREISGKRFRAWVLLESIDENAARDALVEQQLKMTGAALAAGALFAWEP